MVEIKMTLKSGKEIIKKLDASRKIEKIIEHRTELNEQKKIEVEAGKQETIESASSLHTVDRTELKGKKFKRKSKACFRAGHMKQSQAAFNKRLGKLKPKEFKSNKSVSSGE